MSNTLSSNKALFLSKRLWQQKDVAVSAVTVEDKDAVVILFFQELFMM